MNDIPQGDRQDRYFRWLSERVSPAQLSELYMVYSEIDEYFHGRKILKESLFQTADLQQLKQVRDTIEGNKFFRYTHRRSLSRMSSAVRYYINFIKEQEPASAAKPDAATKQQKEPPVKTDIPPNAPSVETPGTAAEKSSLADGDSLTSEVSGERQGRIGTEGAGNEIKTVDLACERSYAFTVPVSFSYFEEVTPVSSWRELYTKCMALLLDDYPSVFDGLRGSPIEGLGRADIGDLACSANMLSPHKISDNVFVETNYSATNLMKKLALMLDRCNMDPENLQISFRPRTTSGGGYKRQEASGRQQGKTIEEASKNDQVTPAADQRWLPILQDHFPDGYILNDFLSQFQAAGFWQERYGTTCSAEGNAIDDAMKAVGTVMNDRVFASREENVQLISDICTEVSNILSRYSTVYRSCIYARYRDRLASCRIYTEEVMTQQLLTAAEGRFRSTYRVFVKPDPDWSVKQDCRAVLREWGGPMATTDIAETLWFIPYDTVYGALSADDEVLNVDTGIWMLAEHFPLTREEARQIGDVLEEHLLAKDYVHANDLMFLIQTHLPSIADNLSGLTYWAVFNILGYYLKDRFSFSKSIISPKGKNVDFTLLFRTFAAEHDTFTVEDLEALASELNLPIYWNNTYNGGAVRISNTDFVNRRLIRFDVDGVDRVLEDICPGDYLPLSAVSTAMMMHFPSCGYKWNGYLLLSYVRDFSNVFRLVCNSLGKSGFYGAMVRKSCTEIDDYRDLVERVLTDDDTWNTTAEALNLLVKRGYQAANKYKDIDAAVKIARQNKARTGGERSAQV